MAQITDPCYKSNDILTLITTATLEKNEELLATADFSHWYIMHLQG